MVIEEIVLNGAGVPLKNGESVEITEDKFNMMSHESIPNEKSLNSDAGGHRRKLHP